MTAISLSSISSQMTDKIFSKLDTGNQGYIDATTLSGKLSDTSDDQLNDFISSLDSDGDSKITKSELSQGIENLFSQLQNASQQANGAQNRPPPPPGGMGGPPPPKGDDEDEGLTKDQMSEIASSTGDTKLSAALSNVAENFEAADTNQDGKVTQQEAQAYQESQAKKNAATTDEAKTNPAKSSEAFAQIARLVKTYGLDETSNDSTFNSAA